MHLGRLYGIPVRYNFRDEDMRWVDYKPKARMLVLEKIFPEGIHVPDFFFGKNIVHLPTVKCHIYTTTTGAMKNAFGGLLNCRPAGVVCSAPGGSSRRSSPGCGRGG